MDIVRRGEAPTAWWCTLGGQTPLKLAERARRGAACPSWAPAPRPSTWPRTATASPPMLDELGITVPGRRHGLHLRGGLRRGRPDRVPRCSCAPATCWAGAAWASSTTARSCEKYMAEAAKHHRPTTRCTWTASWKAPWRWTSTRSATARRCTWAAILEHIEMAGIHSGDSACCTPPFALSEAVRDRSCAPSRASWRCAWAWCGPHQHPVRHQGPGHLHHRGEPARQPHRALRVEGHRRAAGEVRRPHHGGGEDSRSRPARRRPALGTLQREGGRHALRPLPGRRHGAGPRDEVYGRGHGHCRQLPERRSRRRSWPSATRCPKAARCSSRVCDRDKRSIVSIARDIVRLGFHDGGHGRHGAHAGVRQAWSCEEVQQGARGRAQRARHDRRRRDARSW